MSQNIKIYSVVDTTSASKIEETKSDQIKITNEEFLLDINSIPWESHFCGVIYSILPPNLNSKFTFKTPYKSSHSSSPTAHCLVQHKCPFLINTNSASGFELNVGDMDENHRISANSRVCDH